MGDMSSAGANSRRRLALVWRRGVALTERALHQKGVDPLPVFEGGTFDNSDLLESEALVQLDRGQVLARDLSDHVSESQLLAKIDQLGQERSANAGALRVGSYEDAVFDHGATGRACAKTANIGVANYRIATGRHDVRKLLCDPISPATSHLDYVRRFQLERPRARFDRFAVYCGNVWQISPDSRAN